MTEHEELDDVEAAEREMEDDAGEMEESAERLDSHIAEAERAAQDRPEVSDETSDDDE